ncbi:hypothetical protein EG329_005835 [Mollisiaceae sp. DMI_Dod_QoI]|nr:hypothetical protein EG329_005835 [Helotiales sp. DMI_Dod_QoI]
MARPQPQETDSTAPPGQDYEFYPLPDTNHIRLLYLEPDTVTQTLSYTLKPADLSSKPEPAYNYITHAGDRKKEIKCDGKTICITENLESALSQLKEDMASIDESSQKRTPMWIDAICIHQESDDERSLQVAKMDEIYRRAQKVIVWLGPEHNRTLAAIDVLAQLVAVPEENRNADIPSGLSHREIYTTLGIGPIKHEQWLALGELLMRGEEDGEEEDREEEDGDEEDGEEEDGEEEDREEEDREEEDREDEDEDDDNKQRNKGGSVNRDVDQAAYVDNKVNNQWLFESLRKQKKGLKLETLLTYARYFGATCHSDYVYAMRGMWEPIPEEHQRLRETIKPDYKIPVEDVFTAAAFASAVEMGDLNILSLVEDHSLREARAWEESTAREKEKDTKKKENMKSKQLPSWVADWSITPIAETLCMNPRPEKGLERWTASKGLPYTSPTEPIERRLRVKGLRITTIVKKAAEKPKFRDSIDGMEIFALLELLSNLLEHSSSRPSDLIDAFWKTIIKDTYRHKKAGDAARKALTSFLANRIFEASPESLESQTPPAHNSGLKSIEALLNNISARDTTGTIPTYQTIRQIIETEKENVNFAGVNVENKFFAESFRLAYDGRRLFCTAEDGSKGVLLGIGPESLKKWDEVWVIAGADVPMVLRPRGNGEWSLVGECYVHGIMEGEAVHDVSGGRNIQDKKGREKITDIVLV